MSVASGRLLDVFGRRHREPPADAAVAADGDGDPYAPYEPQFAAYLEQARWHLDQQQRRASSFQQTAVAIIGFDGVLLAVLVSGDALSGVTRNTLTWWLVVAGAAVLVLSSLVGLGAVRPRATNVVGANLTVTAWADFNANGGWNNTTQHFAEMLLAANPPSEREPSWQGRIAATVRAKTGRPQPSRQPLLAATHLANARGRWASWSGALLAVGIALLAAALMAAPADAPSTTPQLETTHTNGGTHD